MSMSVVLSPKKVLAALVLSTAAMAVPASAQTPPPNGGGQPGQPGGGGGGNRPDPAQMRQRFEERMKQQLGVNDDEWKAIQPKIDKVQTLQRASRGGFGGFGGRGGRGGPNGGGPGAADTANQSPVQAASQALRTTLENKDASPEDIKTKLAALRDARAKAQAELKVAQEDLKSVLTARQEAVMVTTGMLE